MSKKKTKKKDTETDAPEADESTFVVDRVGEEDTEAAEEVNEAKKEAGSKRRRKRKRKKKKDDEKEDDNNEEAQPQHTDSVEHTVYVEGIPFDATPDQVKEFFESNGISNVMELRLPTWQDSGRLRGYGHVLFASQESYNKALKLSGKYLQKRYLTIQPANAPKHGGGGRSFTRSSEEPPPKDCLTLFVNNLPYAATEEEIARVFEKYGKIAEDGVRIARNSVTRQSKGFAYVDFASPNDAQKVVQACTKKNLTVGGRIVRLDYDTGRIKGSFRTDSGRLWAKETKEKKRQRLG